MKIYFKILSLVLVLGFAGNVYASADKMRARAVAERKARLAAEASQQVIVDKQLKEAITENRVADVQLLLKTDADINSDLAPLVVAAEAGNEEIFDILRQIKNINVNQKEFVVGKSAIEGVAASLAEKPIYYEKKPEQQAEKSKRKRQLSIFIKLLNDPQVTISAYLVKTINKTPELSRMYQEGVLAGTLPARKELIVQKDVAGEKKEGQAAAARLAAELREDREKRPFDSRLSDVVLAAKLAFDHESWDNTKGARKYAEMMANFIADDGNFENDKKALEDYAMKSDTKAKIVKRYYDDALKRRELQQYVKKAPMIKKSEKY